MRQHNEESKRTQKQTESLTASQQEIKYKTNSRSSGHSGHRASFSVFVLLALFSASSFNSSFKMIWRPSASHHDSYNVHHFDAIRGAINCTISDRTAIITRQPAFLRPPTHRTSNTTMTSRDFSTLPLLSSLRPPCSLVLRSRSSCSPRVFIGPAVTVLLLLASLTHRVNATAGTVYQLTS